MQWTQCGIDSILSSLLSAHELHIINTISIVLSLLRRPAATIVNDEASSNRHGRHSGSLMDSLERLHCRLNSRCSSVEAILRQCLRMKPSSINFIL